MSRLKKEILELTCETIKAACIVLRNERDDAIEERDKLKIENENLKNEIERMKKEIESISDPKPKIILL